MSNFLHKVLQKWLKNLESLSDTIEVQCIFPYQTWNPMQLTNLLKVQISHTKCIMVLLQRTKWDIFENRSTTTMIESLFLCVLGKPTIKSRFISSHGALETDNGVYNSLFWLLVFPLMAHMTLLHNLSTPLFNFG